MHRFDQAASLMLHTQLLFYKSIRKTRRYTEFVRLTGRVGDDGVENVLQPVPERGLVSIAAHQAHGRSQIIFSKVGPHVPHLPPQSPIKTFYCLSSFPAVCTRHVSAIAVVVGQNEDALGQ